MADRPHRASAAPFFRIKDPRAVMESAAAARAASDGSDPQAAVGSAPSADGNGGSSPGRPDTFTAALAGRSFVCDYSSSQRRLHVSFTGKEVFYTVPPEGDRRWVRMPYRARLLREGLYLVHALGTADSAEAEGVGVGAGVTGATHVTLVLDLEREVVYGTGDMAGGVEMFDVARIEKEWQGGENAVWDLKETME